MGHTPHAEPPVVVIDCDPGIDDTLALIYLVGLHRAGEIELAAVTTSSGNTHAHVSAANARWILELCGEHVLADAAVTAGQPVPARCELVTTPETHGAHGLGYAQAPQRCARAADRELSAPEKWQRCWLDALARGGSASGESAGRDVHLIVTGPLTNAAAFAAQHPDEMDRFSSVTVMGGAVNYRGNTTPTAEWNFWVDPYAARDFFARPTRELTTLCSLEVTEQMLLTPKRLDALVAALGKTPMGEVLPDIVRFYFEFHEAQGEGYQAQVHDLLTCLIALGRADCAAVDTTIAVEADSELLRGTSVADLRGHWARPANSRLVTAADIDGAFAEFFRGAGLVSHPASGWLR